MIQGRRRLRRGLDPPIELSDLRNPGWDYGGPAPATSSFPATRSASHHDLQQVADVCMANLEQKPAEAVQDAFGVSRSTADRRIRDVRKAGLITATAARGRKPKS
ncbi:hypothetical protein [Brachybacterium epidermidis]|uniref:hypothetical protein n=1 Tax=Brachybacterium epidermidis TaxID=2781983 RepID=UPI00398F285E